MFIMEKPMLSPAGVTEKTNELYQLPEAELNIEATLINSDISSWMQKNFETTQAQREFLNSLPADYLSALSEQASRAVRHRWPIIFKTESATGQVLSSKWVRSKEDDEAGTNPTMANGKHIGKLTIETGY